MEQQLTMVVSGKGGTGKTSFSVYLSAALSAAGKRVLLIETDNGLRGVDLLLGVTDRIVFDLGDVLAGRCSAEKATVACSRNLHVIAASAVLSELAPAEEARQLIRLSKALLPRYDHIILDIPAGFSPVFAASAPIADRAVIITTTDPVCVRDCAITSVLLEKLGMPPEKQRLVINCMGQFHPTPRIRDFDDIIDEAGVRLLAVLPDSNEIRMAGSDGVQLGKHSVVTGVFSRVIRRLYGEDIPLMVR